MKYLFATIALVTSAVITHHANRRAVKLPHWHASPLDTDLDGPPLYGHETCRAISRPDALEIRREILTAMGHSRRRQKHPS